MVLDITAYSHLTPVGRHTEGWCTVNDEGGDLLHVRAYAYTDFPASFAGLPVLGHIAGHSNLLDGGCYQPTDKTETHAFQAGSYSGYNAWRADLAAQFNPAPDPDKPFYELIWFADNQGCIGPEAAFHLLDDFRVHVDEYRLPGMPGELVHDYYRQRYAAWTTACELAADGGLIHFH